MPPRRIQSKSHHGCLQCKRRSVKLTVAPLPTQCDEKRPKCTRCFNRRSACQYSTLCQWTREDLSHRGLSDIGGTQSTAQHNYVVATSHQRPQERGDFNTQHLRLLLHWTTTTYRSISRSEDLEWIWQHTIPRLSLSHPFLLHGVLALAALHLTLTSAEETEQEDLIRAAEYHQSEAITFLTPALTNTTSSTCDAAFSLSLILVIFTFGFPLAVGPTYGSNSLDDIYQVLMFTKRMMTFSVGIYESVKNGEVGGLAVLEDSGFEPSDSTLSTLSALCELNMQAQRADAAHDYDTIQETIQRLEVPLASLNHGEGLPSIFMWIFLTPTAFFDLVSKRDPLALIVLAHYCVPLHYHRANWWLSSWGYRVLDIVYNTLDSHLRPSLTWPICEIGYKEREG
ncbi:uncharacterized protein N7446_001005 [Penicillium canescens]|nr:uncharacterized protein N7446_001005 [Penicillium canescens]KAJ6078069.1 hypothetical protein N7446_001005 [Penicillium canescens]